MRTTIRLLIVFGIFACVFTSCEKEVPYSVTVSYSNLERAPHGGGKYYKIPAGKTEVILTNLPRDKYVELVRVNTSSGAIPHVATVTLSSNDSSRRALSKGFETVDELVPSSNYSMNSNEYIEPDDGPHPVPFIDKTDYEALFREIEGNVSARRVGANRMIAGSTQLFEEGDTKSFYVSDNRGTVSATLKEVGTNCYVWVADANYDNNSTEANDHDNYYKDNKLTQAQAERLASAFDSLFEKEKTLIGNSYERNPYPQSLINPQDRISLFVYDIDDDYESTQNGGTFGMFWGGDFFDASVVDGSNEMEMLYVDAHFTDIFFESVISTLSHEFEHMLYFVHKRIGRSRTDGEDWYKEMGAMMVEDCLADYFNRTYQNFVPSRDSTISRLSTFNATYPWGGLGYWGDEDEDDNAIYTSYAIAGIFGCWLQRNYGGERLIKEIVTNNATNEDSITKAIRACGSNDSFFDALRKFAISFALPYASNYTLNKSTTGNYPLIAADPWDNIYRYTISGRTYVGPCWIRDNYSGELKAYGFWINGWDCSSYSGIKLVFSAASGEENYIVIPD